jgi:hypothetical protein
MNMRHGRIRFSLATALLVTSVVAILLAVWKVVTYEPYTHRFSLYEKAEGTRGNSITVGPTEVTLGVVARNDRDGTIRFENGRGRPPAKKATANRNTLVATAPWLDLVEISLRPTPDRIDVIEARVFDHKTRELTSVQWRMAAPDVLQIYRIGGKLPETLDVWFRAQSYPADDAVATLATTLNSKCSLPGGTATLADMQDGFWGYTSGQGLVKLGHSQPGTTLLISWDGKWGDTDYQISAVSKTGQRSHTDTFHFLRLWDKETRHVFFDMPLEEVDRFEFRPFGGRHVFFFEGVTLPKTSNQPFAKPSTVKVPIGGRETKATLTEFSPLEFRLQTQTENQIETATASDGLEAGFTLTYQCTGRLKPKFRFFDRNSVELTQNPGPSMSQTGGSSQVRTQGSAFYNLPLEQVDSIEVTLELPSSP